MPDRPLATVPEVEIAAFLGKIEGEIPVEDLCYKGVAAWPLIRLSLASSYYHDRVPLFCRTAAKARQEQAASPRSLANITQAEAVQALRAAVTARLGGKSAQALFLTFGYELERLDGVAYNKFADPIKEILEANAIAFLDLRCPFMDKLPEPRKYPVLEFVDILHEANALQRRLMPDLVMDDMPVFDELAAAIRAKGYFFNLDYYSVAASLELFLLYRDIFFRVFENTGASAVFINCFYSPVAMPCIAAAKEAGAIAVELQHCNVPASHCILSGWTKIPDAGYAMFPTQVWTWGLDTHLPLKLDPRRNPTGYVPKLSGNIWMGKCKEMHAHASTGCRNGPARYILYTMKWPSHAEGLPDLLPDELLRLIELSPPDWRYCIRAFEPDTEAFKQEVEAYLSRLGDKVSVQLRGERQLYDLLSLCDYHISQGSTVSLEAEAMGVGPIVVGPGLAYYREDVAANRMLPLVDPARCLAAMQAGWRPAPRKTPVLHADLNLVRELVRGMFHLEDGCERKKGVAQ